MAAEKGSKALYGSKAAQEKAAKEMRRRDAQVPFYEISSSAFDDGVTRTFTEDNPSYKPTRGGSKLPGTRARLKAAEELLKKNGADKPTRADILRTATMKKGGKVKKMAAGGSVSKRADGCATKGKTKGRFV
jgi:hypothetical protein